MFYPIQLEISSTLLNPKHKTYVFSRTVLFYVEEVNNSYFESPRQITHSLRMQIQTIFFILHLYLHYLSL